MDIKIPIVTIKRAINESIFKITDSNVLKLTTPKLYRTYEDYYLNLQ